MHATSGLPIWLFDPSGTKLLFANPAGAALFGFASSSAAMAASFENTDIARQVARSAATLRQDGTPRLERLRGMGMPFGRPLICACSKMTVASATAILVAAAEPCNLCLTLFERARRLIESDEAIAAFDPDGNLLHATPSAARYLAGATLLADVHGRDETLYVGEGADAVTLLLLSDENSRQSQEANISISDATAENTVDLSPIADAMAAMTVDHPSHDPSQHVDAPRHKDVVQSDAEDAIAPGSQQSAEQKSDRHQRRHPLRFVWETDAENRFTITDHDFLCIAGPRTAGLMGRFWNEVSAKLALDPEGRIAHAMVSRDTWSGIDVDWPTKEGQRIKIELCGIPALDQERLFCGYRGWGVWRDQPLADHADNANPADVSVQPAPAHAETAADIHSLVPKVEERVALPVETEPEDVAATPENVVPFRAIGQDAPVLVPAVAEQTAFQELTSRLAMRLKGADELARGQIEKVTIEQFSLSDVTLTDIYPNEQTARDLWRSENDLSLQTPILDRLPVGLLIYRLNSFIYANPAFLKLTGYASIGDFAQAGGLDSLFIETVETASSDRDNGQSLRIAAPASHTSMDGRLVTLPIDDEDAMALVLFPNAAWRPTTGADATTSLSSLLDIATDGVVVIDRNGQILEANAGAARLFGYDKEELPGHSFTSLFAPDNERAASASLERLTKGGSAGPIDDGREFIGRRRHGSLLFLNVLLARVDQNSARFCAIFRDITRWKNAEKDLTTARQQAEKASSAKSEFLARISHEMRTPLNAIIGFSDVMTEERFGPIGNDRYRDYLKDIKASGSHLVSLLNDLLDLSKIEAGKMELSFERVNLNDLTQQSVAIMQAQANRARVIIRTALSMNVPGIVADPRSVRQIILNLLSNSIKFTSAGGQVIVSTAATDRGDVMLRVRDTGIGMSEQDIETALQPFRQLATSAKSGGTGLGLPLTKALTEANRAQFSIKSAVNSGTMVEIVFPAARVLAK
ncbi:PAS domain S-box protein [Pseudorhodoplanes sinuspersici]|uniref:PAS domain S-box protein n=1 Tax=Pseudorhodoplanes sinuspersici TaxID=1235591 RepID=UPI001600E763|nr:PAS domain S-box protein [Pseudorhodoplanes sinuspersici]